MISNSQVNGKQGRYRRVCIGARYPLEGRKRLELIQVQRGDRYLSETIAAALDEFIARHRDVRDEAA